MLDQLTNAIKLVMNGEEGKSNGMLMMLLSQIDSLARLAFSVTDIDESLHTKVVARTLLDYEQVLRDVVNNSPSGYDDAILTEALQIANQIVPEYVPVS